MNRKIVNQNEEREFMNKSMVKTLLSAFSVTFFAAPAYAYVDPATTAMITQIVAGIIISLSVAIGIFRRKIFLFFKNLSVGHIQRKIEKENRKTADGK